MGNDSTPSNPFHEFEDKNHFENLTDLFGDSFSDVTSYLNDILLEVDQRVVNELFEKIALMK